ncbi:esterase/lipase family protein [Pendulispora albinea]|uniref:DUF676 domain-containing protein n=1 Tax=Pendulispora albinea TaxID=2741071 RepID=A0ABZ2LPN4_9BACT
MSEEQSWGLWKRASDPPVPPAPKPDATWEIPGADRKGGIARVYLANSKMGLVRPVILADGFNWGPSNLDELWQWLNEKQFAFADELRRRGHDLILLGYDDRAASILHNATIAHRCIRRATEERLGSAPLAVGGFSMGGMVTRYALARMENEGIDHQTAVYMSFDSPHRGAWIPISLQALAHFVTIAPTMSKQINSPAARQLLVRHIPDLNTPPREDPERTQFLAELTRVGSWPRRPRLLGVANGSGTGQGNGIRPGEKALECTKGGFKPTTLYTQSSANGALVASLKGPLQTKEVRTSELPEVDGAPGGTLESFAIAADNLTIPVLGMEAVAHHREVCFVPSISAVAVLDIDPRNLYTNINELPPDKSDLDDYFLPSRNTPHSEMSAEIGEWILDRLPR